MGRTYPQGYDGPDIYNYTYMDLTPYGLLEDLQTTFTNSYKLVERDTSQYVGIGWKYKNERDWLGNEKPGYYEEIPINYVVNEGGIRMKPITVTGSRRMEGTIQAAYRNYIQAYLKVQEVMSNYDTKLETLKIGVDMAKSAEKALWQTFGVELGTLIAKVPVDTMEEDYRIELGNFALNLMMVDDNIASDGIPGISSAGMTIAIDPKALIESAMVGSDVFALDVVAAMTMTEYQTRHTKQLAGMIIDLAKSVYDMEEQIRSSYDEIRGKIDEAAMEVNLAVLPIQPAFADLAAAEAAYRAEVERGQQLMEQRALWRQQVSNNATEQRYLDSATSTCTTACSATSRSRSTRRRSTPRSATCGSSRRCTTTRRGFSRATRRPASSSSPTSSRRARSASMASPSRPRRPTAASTTS